MSTPRRREIAPHQPRVSDELKSCSNKLPLRLEDDAPLSGERAVFNVDILDPCWIYERADLSRASNLVAIVGQIPFNFQVGDAVKQVPLYPPRSASGELEVRLDSCDGELLASVPLDVAARENVLASLPPAAIAPRTGTHDLCLRFTRRSVDPMWVIQSVRIVER